MIYILIFLSAFYVSIILYHLIGWELTKDIPLTDIAGNMPFCTIIVPVRNEEKNISACLDSLLEQNYAGDYEVIVVDDHSTDETTAIVQHRIGKLFVNGHRHLKLLRFEGEQQIGKSYKKQAITKAIAAAAGDIILTTDGDCSRGNNWLTVMVRTMEQQQLQLLSGPVGFNHNNHFEGLQALEFWGLIGIGGAAIRMGTPNMCNGANMAYRKKVFHEVNGYAGNDHLSSGDDEFLMHKVYAKYPGGVKFVKNKAAVVTTHAMPDTASLMQQRKRWVSKSTSYQARIITVLMALVYLYNLSIVFCGVYAWFNPVYLTYFAAMLFAKAFAEALFLYRVLRQFNQLKLLCNMWVAEPLHILYVLYVGIAGLSGSYEWKGRQVK